MNNQTTKNGNEQITGFYCSNPGYACDTQCRMCTKFQSNRDKNGNDFEVLPEKETAIAFALWLQQNRWFNFDQQAGKWCYTFEVGISISRASYEKQFMKTSDELYAIFAAYEQEKKGGGS